jgi:hypothetical protein
VTEPIRLFCGFDRREALGYAVFCHSVIKRASRPVSFIPLSSMGLPEGTNNFTVSRFLVPWLCNFEGWAIFCDAADMLMLGDVAELYSLQDERYAVQVVQHPDYKTRHTTKYRGTSMECPNSNYPRKNWASVMLVNCAHIDWLRVKPEYLAETPIKKLLELGFLGELGQLPPEWNCLVDEGQPAGELLHWTAGVPGFEAYHDAPYANLWHDELRDLERVG